MLDDKTKEVIKDRMKEMDGVVTLLFFKSEDANQCKYCNDIVALYTELKELSNGKLLLKELSKSNPEYSENEIEETPATVILGKEKRFIRYYGIPAGHEFGAFLQILIDVSKGRPDISKDFEQKIKSIDFPVRMRVFVSPTCPHCPGAMKVAHDFALINPNIKGDVYEVTEFMSLATKYNVSGVPKTVINEIVDLVGAYPPDAVIQKILTLKQ